MDHMQRLNRIRRDLDETVEDVHGLELQIERYSLLLEKIRAVALRAHEAAEMLGDSAPTRADLLSIAQIAAYDETG